MSDKTRHTDNVRKALDIVEIPDRDTLKRAFQEMQDNLPWCRGPALWVCHDRIDRALAEKAFIDWLEDRLRGNDDNGEQGVYIHSFPRGWEVWTMDGVTERDLSGCKTTLIDALATAVLAVKGEA